MTVVSEIEKAIAMAEASKGNYLLFAADSEDQQATKVFRDMAQDMERHVQILESRREYLTKHNTLNAGAAQGKQGQEQDGQQKKQAGNTEGNQKAK